MESGHRLFAKDHVDPPTVIERPKPSGVRNPKVSSNLVNSATALCQQRAGNARETRGKRAGNAERRNSSQRVPDEWHRGKAVRRKAAEEMTSRDESETNGKSMPPFAFSPAVPSPQPSEG